jgi:hypothetical protein
MISQMNRLKFALLLSILMALMTVSSCEFFSDEETDKKCKENALDDPVTLIISADYQITRHLNKPDEWHNLMDAYQIDFIGTVRKVDCRDDEAEYSDFVTSCYPANYTTGLSSFTCTVDDFQFLFTNKLEYITVTFYLKAYFKDSKIYDSGNSSQTSLRIRDWDAGADHYFMNFYGASDWHNISN